MPNDISSSNELIKNIKTGIIDNNALNSMYSLSREEQQNKLRQIFVVIEDNNVSSDEKNALLTSAEKIKKKLEELEAKMAVLEEQMASKEDAINRKAEEIASLMVAINDKSSEVEKKQHDAVKNIISDVFRSYENGNIKKDTISAEINKRIKSSTYKIKGQLELKGLIGKLSNNEDEVKRMSKEVAGWIDQKKAIGRQYGATKTAYELIGKTISQIGNTGTSYTNLDTDTNRPVYSLDKTATIADLFSSDAGLNVASTNTNYGGTPPTTINSINEKYSQFYGTKTSVQGAFQNLNKAIQNGLLDDLKNSNMTKSQIAEFFAKNYSSANFTFDKKTGNLNLPYVDTSSQQTCNQITSFIKDINENHYIKNTWDEFNGNTIDSNEQLKTLAANYENVINTLANGDPKMSFKEAMFALFDSEEGLFKNTGIHYDLDKQTGKPSYTIDAAGDKETQDFYKSFADEIKKAWGVDATFVDTMTSASIEKFGGEPADPNDPATPNPKPQDRIPRPSSDDDPITFITTDKDGNKVENAFVIDRNNDGKFTDASELAGAKSSQGISWYDDLKALADEDGVIRGENLAKVKILSSTYHDNTQGSGEKGKSQTDIDYALTNALEMGIEEIDLKGLAGNIEDNLNKETGEKDINGSSIFNDTLLVKMKDQEEPIQATRKDDTKEFMDTVYKDAGGKSFNVGFTKEQVDSEIENAYDKFNDFDNGHKEMYNNATILDNFDNLVKEANQLYTMSDERMSKDESIQKIQAANKAAALKDSSSWSSIYSEVMRIASDEGIAIDVEQAKGIFMREKGQTARQVVDTYKKQTKMKEDIDKERNQSKIATDALIKCTKNGIKQATISEIKNLLSSGKAISSQDVVDILKEKYNVK